jgi:aminoglycoside phosphotransferase (APT) family kinase protein
MKTALLPEVAPAVCDAAFLEYIMRQHSPGREVAVRNVRARPLDSSASILANLTASHGGRQVGLFGLAVEMRADGGPWETRQLVLKIKPSGREISQMLTSLATACGGPLAEVYPAFELQTGFAATHHQELSVYGETRDQHRGVQPLPLLPTIWATHADPASETYYVLMENLEGTELLNSVLAPESWTDAHLRAALSQLAAWHAHHLGTSAPLSEPRDARPSRAYMTDLTPLWEALLHNAATHCPDLYTPARVRQQAALIQQIPAYWQALEQQPKTLIHNDLNPRNTCFKRRADGSLQLVAYDWELATYHVPHYDVVELLTFVLGPERAHLYPVYLAHYRQALHEQTGLYASQAEFDEVYHLASHDFSLHRLGMYLMAHSLSPYPFLPRVVEGYFAGLK